MRMSIAYLDAVQETYNVSRHDAILLIIADQLHMIAHDGVKIDTTLDVIGRVLEEYKEFIRRDEEVKRNG